MFDNFDMESEIFDKMKPDDVILRNATIDDLPIITKLSYLLDDECKTYIPFKNDRILAAYKHATKDELEKMIHGRSFLVAVHNDTPIGFIKLKFNKPEMYIAEIIIDKKFRGGGLGKNLLARCLTIAKDQDCSLVTLSVLSNNTAAKHLYTSAGFKPFVETMYLKV